MSEDVYIFRNIICMYNSVWTVVGFHCVSVETKMISKSMQSPEFYIVQQVYCLTARKIQYKRPGVGVVVGAGSIH